MREEELQVEDIVEEEAEIKGEEEEVIMIELRSYNRHSNILEKMSGLYQLILSHQTSLFFKRHNHVLHLKKA